jgi:type II secretion system protein N
MFYLKRLLYFIIAIPLLIVLIWLFAVPTSLIHERINDAITGPAGNNIEVTISDLKKGILLSLHADTVEIKSNSVSALTLKNLSAHISPQHLFQGKPAILLKGNVGDGDLRAVLFLSREGLMKIENASIDAITYLDHYGISGKGSFFSESTFNLENESADISLVIPDLDLNASVHVIPFADSLKKIQGRLLVKGNRIEVHSFSLEGAKGYARLAGLINNGQMNLKLEVMPQVDKLTPLESMLIGKYIVSPGYYVIPIEGPFLL